MHWYSTTKIASIRWLVYDAIGSQKS